MKQLIALCIAILIPVQTLFALDMSDLSGIEINDFFNFKTSKAQNFSFQRELLKQPDSPFVIKTKIPHKLHIIDDGLLELALRLKMIESAKKSIKLEMFILSTDFSGRLVLQSLIKKAQEGVNVEILVDRSPIFFKSNDYAAILMENGVNIKFYNPREKWHLIHRAQYRDHRKYFSIDEKLALFSGRNQGDDYFNISEEINYYDRGVLIEGPAIKDLDRVFDAFFNHPYTKKPTINYKVGSKKYVEWTKSARDLFIPNIKDQELRNIIFDNSKDLFKKMPSGICTNMTIASDLPGRGMKKKRVHREIFKRIKEIKNELYIESATFILRERDDRQAIHNLLNRGVLINLYTDAYIQAGSSLSTMAVKSISNEHIEYWNKKGMNVYAPTMYETPSTPQILLEAKNKKSHWGVHTKGFLFDDSSFMIGSYNVDPRSKFYSSEVALFCDDSKELTSTLKEMFLTRAHEGVELKNGQPPQGFTKELSKKEKRIYEFEKIPARLFDFLL